MKRHGNFNTEHLLLGNLNPVARQRMRQDCQATIYEVHEPEQPKYLVLLEWSTRHQRYLVMLEWSNTPLALPSAVGVEQHAIRGT